jgi:NADPH-dependent 2,4-dienoyl-CoA reductase/sulfur reductase-like enzyme
MSADAKAKRTDRTLEVIAFERGSYISYAACGMPYYVGGEIPTHEKLLVRTADQMAKQGIDVRLQHAVQGIDLDAQRVTVRDLDTQRDIVESYDQLVIATGARPIAPRLPGSELEGILSLRSLESGLRLKQFLADAQPRRAVVVGGGYIGLEMAEALGRLGLEVTMLIRSGEVMRRTLDGGPRALVHAELDRQGLQVIQGTPDEYLGDGRLEAVSTSKGTYPCEIAIIGIGVQPNVELAESAGVALGASGAIATDQRMETSRPGVYAAGDCAEALHLVTGKPDFIPLGSTANKQGRVAGENAAGGQARFAGVVGTMVVRCYDLVAASTGLTAENARSAGFDVAETTIKAKHISHYFPGAEDLTVKLVVNAESGQLLGGQIVGKKGVAKRIDTLATALYNRMTVGELRQLDLSYAPPFAPVWDPILVAANVAAR